MECCDCKPIFGQRKVTAKLCKINRLVREYHQKKKLMKDICKKYLQRSCRKPEQTKIKIADFEMNIWKFALL